MARSNWLLWPTSAGQEEVTRKQVVVTDPRPPTVTLAIAASALTVAPGVEAALEMRLDARTYTGVGVEGAAVDITWELQRAPRGGGARPQIDPSFGDFGAGGGAVVGVSGDLVVGAPEPAAQSTHSTSGDSGGGSSGGSMVVTVGEGGTATLVVPIGAALEALGSPAAADGDVITVKARWVGPTREVVTAEASVPVSPSPYQLGLALSHPEPLPGTPFKVRLDLRNVHGGGKAAPGLVNVTVGLYNLAAESSGGFTGFKGPLTPAAVESRLGAPVAACAAVADGGASFLAVGSLQVAVMWPKL